MPILANAKKALRVSLKKTLANRRTKSLIKTYVDKALKLPTAENTASAFSQLDKAVKKNVIHKNKAARIKSQVSKAAAGIVAKPALKKTIKVAPKKTATKSVVKKAAKKAIKKTK
jgi:small subunit ribosomal protein S20